MPVNISDFQYPFDPTGTLASNKITGEQQILTAQNFRDYKFIIPKLAPYFYDSLVITFRDQNNNVIPLVENVDWYPTHWFISASRACAKPIYGSITFLNTSLAGVVTLSYQTLGGIWNIDEALMDQILNDKLRNPRTTSWDSVSEMPINFPVIDHPWDLVDMVGMSEVVEALDGIRNAILDPGGGGGDLQAHLQNFSNPHKVTAAQVNLGSVANYPPASQPQAIAGADNASYMTPLRTKQLVDQFVLNPLNDHINDESNPHHVTAEQVGTYDSTTIDQLLASKLGTAQAAADSQHFGGKTPAEFTADVLLGTAANSVKFADKTYDQVKTDILTGKAADSTLFDGRTPSEFAAWVISQGGSGVFAPQVVFDRYTPSSATPKLWSRLCSFTYVPNNNTADYQYMVTGTDSGANATGSPMLLVRVNTRAAAPNQIQISTISMNGIATNARLGYTVEDGDLTTGGTVNIWIETDSDRDDMVVTSIGIDPGAITSDVDDQVVEAEPTGIVYSATPATALATIADLQATIDVIINSLASS